MAVTSQEPASVLINGESTRCLDVADRGLQYGDGLFTTLSVEDGVPLFLDRHLSRLSSDAERLDITFPGRGILAEEARRLCAFHPAGVLKIMLTRGVGGRGYRYPRDSEPTRILSVGPAPDYPADIREQGVKARICTSRLGINPRLAGIKHLNRLEQVMARAEWNDEDIREGLLLDQEGFLVEGVMSNVFLVREGRLRTPSVDRCGVAGVMRALTVEAARGMGVAVEEIRIPVQEAFDAEELFLTNSLIRVWPVRVLNDKELRVGEMARMLAKRIDALVKKELECR